MSRRFVATLATRGASTVLGFGIGLFGVLAVSCYSLTPQDREATSIAEKELGAGYCELSQIDDATLATMGDAGVHVRRARALMRGAHVDVDAILVRNGSDAGLLDAGVGCSP